LENGVTVYDLEFKDGPVEKETDIAADGTMLEYTVVVEAKAACGCHEDYPKDRRRAHIKRIERIESVMTPRTARSSS